MEALQVLSKKEIMELKKKIEPIKKLALHDDADGVTSAVLMSYVFKINKVWAPDDFGEWPVAPYKVQGQEQLELPPDVCVDMVPANPEWVGLAIDHHPNHPPEGKRSYQLIYGEAPASVIVYTLFKELIPQEHRWKVVVGCLSKDTEILTPSGQIEIKDLNTLDSGIGLDEHGKLCKNLLFTIPKGRKELLRITTRKREILVTPEHRLFTQRGLVEAKDLNIGDYLVVYLRSLDDFSKKVRSKQEEFRESTPSLKTIKRKSQLEELVAWESESINYRREKTEAQRSSYEEWNKRTNSSSQSQSSRDENVPNMWERVYGKEIFKKEILLNEMLRQSKLEEPWQIYRFTQWARKPKLERWNFSQAISLGNEEKRMEKPFVSEGRVQMSTLWQQRQTQHSSHKQRQDGWKAREFAYTLPKLSFKSSQIGLERIESIDYEGREEVFDIHWASTNNFFLANGILSHNCVGDGQPELIPPEIWREFPILLEESVTPRERYGKLETSNYPLYLRLSSGINAVCKIPEKWYVGYAILRNAKSPWDLINDSSLKSAKELVESERERIYRETSPIQLRNGIRVWAFQSETKIERTLAWEMWDTDKRTIVAINSATGRGSIRGTLATLVYEHLTAHGFKASGHPGFGGLKLKPDQTWEDVYHCLANLKI